MTSYTVLLAYPDFMIKDGQDIFLAHVTTSDVPTAIEQAQVLAGKDNDYEGDPSVWRCVFCCEGLAENIKDRPAPMIHVALTRKQIRAVYAIVRAAVDAGSNVQAEVAISVLETFRSAAREHG